MEEKKLRKIESFEELLKLEIGWSVWVSVTGRDEWLFKIQSRYRKYPKKGEIAFMYSFANSAVVKYIEDWYEQVNLKAVSSHHTMKLTSDNFDHVKIEVSDV